MAGYSTLDRKLFSLRILNRLFHFPLASNVSVKKRSFSLISNLLEAFMIFLFISSILISWYFAMILFYLCALVLGSVFGQFL